MVWRESQHPRWPKGSGPIGGRFRRRTGSVREVLGSPTSSSVDQLLDTFHQLSGRRKAPQGALLAVYNELARREGAPQLPAATLRARTSRVAYTSGAAYHEAVLVDRRPGETLEKARRRAYRQMVAAELLQAEDDTRGNLLARDCRDRVHPADLWSMPANQARRCASEELKRWWEQHGGRRTYLVWRAGLQAETSARRAAQLQQAAGGGKDFGL